MAEPSPRSRISSRLLQDAANLQASFRRRPSLSKSSASSDNNHEDLPVYKRNAICMVPDLSLVGKELCASGAVGLVHVSKLHVQAIYGGSMGFYTLVLTTPCASPVVVHIMVQSDRARAVRITTARICFTPKTYHIPQAVGVYAVDVTRDNIAVVHRVYSQDERFDQAQVPSVQVAVFGNEASYVWSFGGDAMLLPEAAGGNRKPRLVKGFAEAARAAAPPPPSLPASSSDEENDATKQTLDLLQVLEDPDIYFSSLGCGDNFTVVVSSQSCLAFVYGHAATGALGERTSASTKQPTLLPTSIFASVHEKPAIAALSCGQHHIAVITRAGLLFTWGSGRFGQLGHRSYLDVQHPKHVELDALVLHKDRCLRGEDAARVVVKSVACGGQHTLVITDLQQVVSFGHNKAGQLGLGHRNCRTESGWRSCIPTVIATLTMHSVHQVAAGLHHSACITTQGELYTWGCGVDGRLGLNSSTTKVTPTIVHGIKALDIVPKMVRCGGRHTCIVTSSDELYTWGANDFGQLGLGDTRPRTTPTLVTFPVLMRVLDVSLGQFHSAAVTISGDVFTWGYDVNGGLGVPDAIDIQTKPVMLQAFVGLCAVQVQCGWSHTTVLTRRRAPTKKSGLSPSPKPLSTRDSSVLEALQNIVQHQIPSRPQSARPYQPTPRQLELAKAKESTAEFRERMLRLRPQSARVAGSPLPRDPLLPRPALRKASGKTPRPATAPPKRAGKRPAPRSTLQPHEVPRRPQSAHPRRTVFAKQPTPRFPPPMTPRELKHMTRAVLNELEQLTPAEDSDSEDNQESAGACKWSFLTACPVTTVETKPKTPRRRPKTAVARKPKSQPLALQLDKAKLRGRWHVEPIESVLKEKQRTKEHTRLWLR
ncbi:E3 ubiquitin-protein ligase HERC2-like [Achlya hypogyna]|uniref:E3 ubiquitin-protein ligase HERC2-like n=1 Tax=Achlya hypogyna TaxID=1202772 RepID=A0A1V9YL76_ACHHY|nr:E3 ubiquitin-protein ligase HERC2-like [Achlya hypogyna]